MRTTKFSAVCFSLLCVAFSTACVTSPGDGGRVPGRGSAVPFSGYLDQPARSVNIVAFNFVTNTWDTVGTAVSDTGFLTVWNTPWHYWSTSIVLGTNHWQAGALGFRARTKALYGTVNLSVTRTDFGDCLGENLREDGTLNDFIAECVSHRSPEMSVYTSDYQHGPATCTAVPATTQPSYAVESIPACARQVIANMEIEHISRPVIDEHYFIVHHMPQSFFYDHRRYLRNMQRYLMVFGNKWLPNGNLPFWRPNVTIPVEFRAIKVPPQNCLSQSAGCSGWLNTPFTNNSPNIATPSSLTGSNICSAATLTDLFDRVHGWHNSVHTTVGGTFGTFDSPAGVLFWPWHKYVDNLLAQWEQCS